jgi:hypothetical protein
MRRDDTVGRRPRAWNPRRSEESAMAFFLKNKWQEWAREWGLAHHPHKGWLYPTEAIVGERKGLLLRVGWGSQEKPGLIVCIRFPRALDVERLRSALADDDTLDVLPGKGLARRKMVLESSVPRVQIVGRPPEFILGETSLVWRRVYSFSVPKAAQIASWVDALVAAVGRATPVFDGRCESCGTGVVRRYVLVDGLPAMICTSCQQRMRSEGDMADRTYDMIEVRYLAGATRGLAAALGGAVAWAAIGAATERMFAAAAIGIGALVAWAYRQGAGRVDKVGRAIAAGLTLVSVVAGEILLYAWWVAKAQPEVGFRLDAGAYVYAQAWVKSPGQEIMALVFGLVGAWAASQALQRPKLHANIEEEVDPASEQRKAA